MNSDSFNSTKNGSYQAHFLTQEYPGRTLCALCALAGVQADESLATDEALCIAHNELRQLSAQVLTIQENERQRIATDLHDGVGQSLMLIKMGLDECSAMLSANELGDVAGSLKQIKSKVQETICELRRVVMDMRPSTLDDLGILATFSWFFREFESSCHGIKIEKHLLVQERDIPAELKISIFRILQESISNIVKHAKATHICVKLSKDSGKLHFSIEDNGQGFDQIDESNFCPLGRGLGLVSMKERATFSGGIYQIDSNLGKGTRICISWPCT